MHGVVSHTSIWKHISVHVHCSSHVTENLASCIFVYDSHSLWICSTLIFTHTRSQIHTIPHRAHHHHQHTKLLHSAVFPVCLCARVRVCVYVYSDICFLVPIRFHCIALSLDCEQLRILLAASTAGVVVKSLSVFPRILTNILAEF